MVCEPHITGPKRNAPAYKQTLLKVCVKLHPMKLVVEYHKNGQSFQIGNTMAMLLNIQKDFTYSFIVGYKKNDSNICFFHEINSSYIRISMEYVQNETAMFAGDNDYVRYYDFCHDRLLQKSAAGIKIELEDVITWRDTNSNKYNPVGLPVSVEEMYFGK